MKKKKKLLICFVIFEVVCGSVWGYIYYSWWNNYNTKYLKRFQNSVVLKERYGKINKARIKLHSEREDVENDMYIVGFYIYNEKGEKYYVEPVFFGNSNKIDAYFINNELVYEKEELNN